MRSAGMILLVEDNPDDELLTMRAFRQNNIANDIVVARDGVEALEYLFGADSGASADERKNRIPCLVLLDLNLPRVSGLELLRKIRSDPVTQLIPVVVLTSSKEDRDLVDSYRLGANSFVRKPVDFVEFVEAARQLGLYWLMLNELPASVETK